MNVTLQRKIDRVVGTLICGVFSIFSKKWISVPIDTQPKKILVILLSEMGSLVLARPLFNYIGKKYPSASIYVLLFERNKEILEILNVVPSENLFLVKDVSIFKMLRDSIMVLKKMREKSIDTVLDCELFARISSIYSFLCGARTRVGFYPYTQEGLFRGSYINRRVLYNPYHHISQQFITLACAIESDQVPTAKRQIKEEIFKLPKVKFRHAELNGLRTQIESDFSQIVGKKLILIYPGGGLLPIRAWPLKNFALVAKDLIQKGFVVGIIGMESDRPLAAKIVSYCRSEACIDFTGYTRSIRELMIMFHFASLLITNDGGPGHFASITPVPAIILYGPETPRLYGSLDEKATNMYVPLSCSPCLTAYNHRNSPCNGDNMCLKSIKPEDVVAKAYETLNAQ